VRSALATLPWVEQRTIKPNSATLHVQFGINDRKAYSEKEMRQVLGSRYGATMVVKEIQEVEGATEKTETPTSTPKSDGTEKKDADPVKDVAPANP
jgi:hypothetical protein